MIYEFLCYDCGATYLNEFSVSNAPPIGSKIACECGGQAERIFSTPQLRPEFFGLTMKDVGEKPKHFGTKRSIEGFRRDEFIRSTQGTRLEGKDGKLEYADKFHKQEMQKKQKDRKEKRKKVLRDSLVSASWGKRK